LFSTYVYTTKALDVFVLLQASSKQTKKQQDDADPRTPPSKASEGRGKKLKEELRKRQSEGALIFVFFNQKEKSFRGKKKK